MILLPQWNSYMGHGGRRRNIWEGWGGEAPPNFARGVGRSNDGFLAVKMKQGEQDETGKQVVAAKFEVEKQRQEQISSNKRKERMWPRETMAWGI